jgi:hypothetical protein
MAYAQLKVHADILSDTTTLTSSSLLLSLFDYYGGEDVSDVSVSQAVTQLAVLTHMSCGGIACIRSKWGTDLRSTSFLQPSHEDGFDFGITYHLLEQAWGDQAGINRADLILDGDNFVPGTNGFDINQYIGTQISTYVASDVKAAVSAMAVGQELTLLADGYVTVLHRDSATQITVNYFDTLGDNVPTLCYSVAQGSDVMVVYAWEEIADSSDWLDELSNSSAFSDLGITLVEGLPISTFPKPTLYLVV